MQSPECSSISKQYNQIASYCETEGRFWSSAWFYDRNDLNTLDMVFVTNKTYFVNIKSICKSDLNVLTFNTIKSLICFFLI
jgi:hypothetical protein